MWVIIMCSPEISGGLEVFEICLARGYDFLRKANLKYNVLRNVTLFFRETKNR
jgi:hypothetical protein